MKNKNIFSFLIWSILFFCLFSLNVKASVKQIDMSNVLWNYTKPYIYDNTLKKVELINVPEEVSVSYTGNTGTDIYSYTASAKFSYDDTLYELINLSQSRYRNFHWEIIQGRYDTSYMTLASQTFLENGEIHSLTVQGLPEGLNVTYTNNSHSEPGRYTVTATFQGNPYYERVPEKTAILTIRRRTLADATNTISLTSRNFGIDPNYSINYSVMPIDDLLDLDLSSIGAYRELKGSFCISMHDGAVQTFLDQEVEVSYMLPEELKGLKNLEIYGYTSKKLSALDSTIIDGERAVFDVNSFPDQFLIIGYRNTYTSNEVWKVLLIFTIVLVFVCGVVAGIFVYRRKKKILR